MSNDEIVKEAYYDTSHDAAQAQLLSKVEQAISEGTCVTLLSQSRLAEAVALIEELESELDLRWNPITPRGAGHKDTLLAKVRAFKNSNSHP